MQLFVRFLAKNLHFVKLSLQNSKNLCSVHIFLSNCAGYILCIYKVRRIRYSPDIPPIFPRYSPDETPIMARFTPAQLQRVHYCKIVMPFWAQRVRSSEDHSLTCTSPIWCLCNRTIQSRDCPIPPPIVRGKILVNTAL